MRRIYKYPIEITDKQTIEIPMGAQILAVQAQHGKLYIWALVEISANFTEERTIRVYGTGLDIRDNIDQLKYIGTAQTLDGMLVWHVFEEVIT